MNDQPQIFKEAIEYCHNRFINQGKPANQHKMKDPNAPVADDAIDETKVDQPELGEDVSEDETKGDTVADEVDE